MARSLEAGPARDEALREIQCAIQDGAFGHHRKLMGRSNNGDLKVSIADSKGRERIRMVVDEEDIPRLEFLDAAGNVTFSLPPASCP